VKQVNVAEAKAQLSDLIETALRGEEVVIARRDVPLVRLTAIPSAKVRPRFGCLAGKIAVRADFDEPLDDFGPYR
jgi:antitoxin (DNA-binding transcriptional repressor) of toxin-antitoxin stability system